MPYDLCLRAAGPGTQFIGGANRDELALANHTHLGAELFGFRQVVRVEEDCHPFACDQAGQVLAQSRRRYRIKPGSRLIQEDEWRVVQERAGDCEFLFHAPTPLAHLVLAAFP